MRVRLFELRLLAVALTLLWAAGGGVVLIGYRPGGPWDLLVGVAASLPLPVAVAAIVWPPLVTSNRGSIGVFWIGLIAALLLAPALAALTGQVIAGGYQPLMPSVEVVYPWAAALLATGLYTGLGLSRRLIAGTGFGRRRILAAVSFAFVSTAVIGVGFAGVSLADNAALNGKPAAYSRFGPTSASLMPPRCDQPLAGAPSAELAMTLSGNVDGRGIGTVDLSGKRSGEQFSWTASVVRPDLLGDYGAVRTNSAAWAMSPNWTWHRVEAQSLASDMLDDTVLSNALTPGNRATAEDRGLEYVEGARARHCRIAVDGPIFEAAFPQMVWLIGDANVSTWRGELEYWIFGDGEVGKVVGYVNGNSGSILPHGLLATVNITLTATDRGSSITIAAPK